MIKPRPVRKKNIAKQPTFNPLYPLESLGRILGGAATYIQLKNQSPAAMCGTSVFSAANVAVLGLVKICARGEHPMGVANFFYGEAESGERKSANDDDAYREHRAFDARQRQQGKAALERFNNEMRAWRIKQKALQRTLAKFMAEGRDISVVEQQVLAHEAAEPQRPLRPLMLLYNLTPQTLVRHLAEVYPFAMVLSAEGGTAALTIGDTPMLNGLWDNGYWSSSRITREDVHVESAGLCVHVQFQPAASDKFQRSRSLPYENGFMFRCLYYRPESTQGTRFRRYTDLPAKDIEAYYATMRSLLEEYARDTLPTPIVLTLSPSAKGLLEWLQDELEAEVAEGGWFAQMKGAAAKAVDICARVSAVLHRANDVPGTIVGVDTIRDAIKIVTWHLNQHRMRFCPHTEEELDAIELRDWLNMKVPSLIKQTRNYWYDGPALSRIVINRLRGNVDRLKAALKLLQEQEQIVRVFERVPRPGGGLSGWDVEFTAWIPPLAPIERRDMPPLFSGRLWNGYQQPAPLVTEQREAGCGYELWPGVVLPDM